MEQQILIELQEIRSLLAIVVGTAEQPKEKQFSMEALEKAAIAFQKMTIERGDWITESDLPRHLGPCPWRPGAFIREAFSFDHYIKKGHDYLYFKKDIAALGAELKARNIDLKRYKEFLDDKAAFDKKVAAVAGPPKKAKESKRFKIPPGLKNITTSEIPKPDPERIRQDLSTLKSEFKEGKYENYIDIYKGTYAMLKSMYRFQKYLDSGVKRRCQKWCENFNYANHALELITGKKYKFPVDNQAVIEL